MNVKDMIRSAEKELRERFQEFEEVAYQNQARVLNAFREFKIRELHFQPSSGYGYSDMGREALENIYARVFGSEDALVRPQIVSGTHAIYSCLKAFLKPGDQLVSATGRPYDTLANVISSGSPESLTGAGVDYCEMPLGQGGYPDVEALEGALRENTKMVFIQRSRGYQARPAVPLAMIESIVKKVKLYNRDIIIMVDNCYGEFTSLNEPVGLGVDIMAGSLIKNPGGGLAPNGGYVCGRSELVQKAAWQITAPGLGKELGSIPFDKRYIFMGLFMAPHVVLQSLKGAVLLAYLFEKQGFAVAPLWNDPRSDIVQSIRLKDAEQVRRFCQLVQRYSPIDSDAALEYGELPGYMDGVVMAAGTFIQGSSIELSCDAPLREPYCAFWQGGLTYEHCRYVCERLVEEFMLTS